MDKVFKAINDPSRRLLLDALFEHDAQSLGALCARLPEMTRYGVMNHLRVLEAAGLVTTTKQGRSKLHYLNPVPIRLIQDRWISKYAEPRVAAIADLKARVEEGGAQLMGSPDHIYKAYINGSQAAVWEAITNPDQTEQYFYGTRVVSDWEVGSSMNYYYANGDLAADGAIIAVDAPSRLEFTFHARWDPELVTEGPVREVWSLAEINGMTEVTIELFDAPVGSKTLDDFANGFPYIVSGLKSLVETGKGLPAPY
ncbi:MAG: helix-turn-helix domain-containing protein [bacterium]|nr:helix-turn-helix domain-containing protein [bacterium]